MAGLFASAILINPPASTRAQDTNAPAAEETAPAKPKKSHETIPFHGKLVSVDTDAMTFVVGKRTFTVTSETKISKDGAPATLSDGVVGENVGGAYKKAEDGTLKATTVNFGKKPEKEKAE
ncbi:MAG: hypothetical protein WDM76_12290 [Limisphaerales bacterium]